MPSAESAMPSEKLVLIVDDDEGTQEFLAFALRAEGFRVEQAFDGRRALRKIQSLLPDLVLLDMMFPRHGGEDVLALMRGHAKAIPVIAMSGRAQGPYTSASVYLADNVVEFFEKPLDAQRLTKTIHRVLGTRPGAPRAG